MTASDDNTLRTVRHVTWVGFWVNALLMIIKIAVGLWGHSDALVADGIHSLSDFATDLMVIVFVTLAYRRADHDHPYGHGKFETLGTLIIGLVLLAVGVGIAWGGVTTIAGMARGINPPAPDVWTLAVACISVLAKEWLYRYTARAGKRVDSPALVANAWHHRSDAISSLATVAGIGLVLASGGRWELADPIATIVIAGFIVWSALCICRPALDQLLEKSLPPGTIGQLARIIRHTPGVEGMHRLRTRHNGQNAIVDVHIKVNGDLSVTHGHAIATAVEQGVRQLLGNETIVGVHVEPVDNSRDEQFEPL